MTKKVARAILLPPFPVNFVASAACLIAFAAWIYFDPWFAMIAELLKPMASGPGEVTSYDRLRPTFQTRVNIFLALRILAIVATAFAVIRMFVGSGSGRSIASWLLMTALLGAWLGFLLSHERIRDAGFRSRVLARIDELQTLANRLNAYDGKANEVKTNIGTYAIDPVRMPNTFQLRTQRGWWTHTDPWMILRLSDGGLLMLISGWNRLFVEYHPEGSAPSIQHIPRNPLPFGSKFAQLSHSESLEDGWYLTAYDE